LAVPLAFLFIYRGTMMDVAQFEAWILDETTNNAVAAGMIAMAIFTVLGTIFVAAPYGRYSDSRWGPLINAKVCWVFMESPNLIWTALFLAFYSREESVQSVPNMILLGMFAFHYTNRTLIFPFRLRGVKPMPISMPLLAVSYCFFNGYLQASSLTRFTARDPLYLGDPRFLAGVFLFFCGWYINVDSDARLRNLRKPGETGYKIPRGGMFEYVSGANFFGEILEWTGFAIASWSMAGVAFALYTAANIGPRALKHHQYYLDKFKEEYPKERKALIPFLL